MKKYLVLGLLVVAVLLAIPLAAAEEVKIKLPDGLYLYDAHTEQLTSGGVSIRFQKFIVVQNNIIYSSQEAIKKFGITKLNELFAEKKKLKILLSGEKIGEILNLEFYNRRGPLLPIHYKAELLTKDIKEGPAYGSGGYGSAIRYMAVPEEYKEVKNKVYTTISQEEVDKIAKLAKEKLLPLVIKRKELTQYKIKETELVREELDLLDKVSHRDDALYIGVYRYVFKTPNDGVWEYKIVFSAKNDAIHFITSNYNYENATLLQSESKICGMFDIDGDGEQELIIGKTFGGEDGATTNMQIHKQIANGNWQMIRTIKNN